jgi:glyoxylase-like metal-dependent hydrolase (beta-lactamase superfamily II)
MQHWRVGETRITRIEELMGPLFDPVTFFPDYSADLVAKHRDWIYPDHIDEDSGRIIASMHSWLIETPHHNILVDTCIGNDKERMPYRDWHRMQTPWLSNLKAAGVTPDQIDYVMCTHLHVDHVGWNTRLQDGRWIPTFPNAKYVFSQIEFDFWKNEREAGNPEVFNAVNNQTFDDSVLPVMGLAQLIDGEVDLIDDLLHISPAPGHTPGSITLTLSSTREKAIFTGDICHHPIQVYEPHWNSAFCEIPDKAISTRKEVLEFCVESRALMMPAHFGPSFAGYVEDSGTGFSFKFR